MVKVCSRLKLPKYDDSTVLKILELVENTGLAVLENFVTRFARVYTPVYYRRYFWL